MKFYKNYDCVDRRTHTVKVTFQTRDYKGSIAYAIGGNMLGLNVMDSIFDYVAEDDVNRFIINDCNFKVDNETEFFDITLRNEQGDMLTITDLEQNDIENMVVAIEIIDCKEAK